MVLEERNRELDNFHKSVVKTEQMASFKEADLIKVNSLLNEEVLMNKFAAVEQMHMNHKLKEELVDKENFVKTQNILEAGANTIVLLNANHMAAAADTSNLNVLNLLSINSFTGKQAASSFADTSKNNIVYENERLNK